MRIIDPKDPHALLAPIDHNTFQLAPKLLPILALEIDRIDVLVFLRRILGVLDRTVRTSTKPFGMLFHIRMIRRALKRDVESDFQTLLLGLGD